MEGKTNQESLGHKQNAFKNAHTLSRKRTRVSSQRFCEREKRRCKYVWFDANATKSAGTVVGSLVRVAKGAQSSTETMGDVSNGLELLRTNEGEKLRAVD